MDTNTPLALLGGLTASQFMRKHWQKKPLLVRQAIPDFKAAIPRAELLAMTGQEGVESRLIQHLEDGSWKLSHGPLSRRSLPALNKPGWTVLVLVPPKVDEAGVGEADTEAAGADATGTRDARHADAGQASPASTAT